MYITALIFAAIAIVAFCVFAVMKFRKQQQLLKKYPGYPKDYWLSQGMGIGVALGAGLGAAFNNLAIGIAIGVAIGAAIGSALEKKNKDQIRPITDEEKALRKQTGLFMMGSFGLAVVFFLVAYFLLRS